MCKSAFGRHSLIVLVSALSLVNIACSNKSADSLINQTANAAPTSAEQLAQKPSSQPKKSAGTQAKKPHQTTADPYSRAIDIAIGANTISQSAVSREDWSLAASRWQESIKLLKAVPASSRNYGNARKRLTQYQSYLADARLRAAPHPQVKSCSDTEPQFFSVPITDRVAGIPVIEVNFNNQQKFPMIFDTGASKTLITQSMAATLRLIPVGFAKVQLANGSVAILPIAKVESNEIDGRITRDVQVAVAPPKMEIGLLGQDFYKGYDITIGEHSIEFHRQSNPRAGKKGKTTAAKTCLSDTTPQFFRVPIKSRMQGIPLVEVTFNGQHKFPMLFDTGASSTLVTQSMATKLKLFPVGTRQVTIADGSVVTLPVAPVKSKGMNGRLKRDVLVSVAPPAMDVGLLGQDFYEGYNVTIKEKVIEFRRQRF